MRQKPADIHSGQHHHRNAQETVGDGRVLPERSNGNSVGIASGRLNTFLLLSLFNPHQNTQGIEKRSALGPSRLEGVIAVIPGVDVEDPVLVGRRQSRQFPEEGIPSPLPCSFTRSHRTHLVCYLLVHLNYPDLLLFYHFNLFYPPDLGLLKSFVGLEFQTLEDNRADEEVEEEEEVQPQVGENHLGSLNLLPLLVPLLSYLSPF